MSCSDASWQQVLTMIDNMLPDNPMTKLVEDFPIKDTDIIVSTYPKVGTTWTQQIVHQLRTGGDEDFDDINEIVPFVLPKEFRDDNMMKANNYHPRAFKTHVIADDAVKMGGRHITVFRDPIDTVVSMYHFMAGIVEADLSTLSIEDFYFGVIACFDKPTYYESMLSYHKQRDNPNFLLLFYEDMREDLRPCVAQIAKFIDVKHDDGLIDLVCERAGLDYMRKHHSKFDNLSKIETLKAKGRELGRPAMKVSESGNSAPFTGTLREGKSGYEVPYRVRSHIEARWKVQVGRQVGCDTYKEYRQKYSLTKKE